MKLQNCRFAMHLFKIIFRNKLYVILHFSQALELLKDYIPGRIENSAKMEILFCIIKESISLGDRLLVFSQSLITLDLIEQFLQASLVPGDTVNWCKNTSYYRKLFKSSILYVLQIWSDSIVLFLMTFLLSTIICKYLMAVASMQNFYFCYSSQYNDSRIFL